MGSTYPIFHSSVSPSPCLQGCSQSVLSIVSTVVANHVSQLVEGGRFLGRNVKFSIAC